jgi:hypothetical protein
MTSTKRLHLGGLGVQITTQELTERFKSFGEISNCTLHQKNDVKFAFLNITTTPTELKKLIAIYNKTKWKGHTLSVAEAKQDYTIKYERERATKNDNSKPLITRKKMKRKQNQHFEDMTIPTNDTKRVKWVRARYGRLLPKIKMRLPQTGRETLIDPVKYINNYERFSVFDKEVKVADLHFETGVKMDLSRDSIKETKDSFRKRCGMWTEEEIELAAKSNLEMKMRGLEEEREEKESGLSKKRYRKEKEIRDKFNTEQESMREIVAGVKHGENKNDKFLDFMDEEDIIEKVDTGGLFDSDSGSEDGDVKLVSLPTTAKVTANVAGLFDGDSECGDQSLALSFDDESNEGVETKITRGLFDSDSDK